MRDENIPAIQALQEKIRIREEEVRQLKLVVNGFYEDENEDPPYPDARNQAKGSVRSIRGDQFYGNTLAEAAQAYLEIRKASGLGSASVNDIYDALKSGGYAFDTQKEEYAKNGVRISLRKNPKIFHQLPGGDYGLCSWYGVKGKNEEDKPRKRKPKHGAQAAARKPTAATKVAHTANGSAKADEPVSRGQFTTATFEEFVRKKPRRFGHVATHFGVTESEVKKLIEPASKVYVAGIGWLKVRE